MTALLTRDDMMPATLTPTAPLDAPTFRLAQPSRTNGHLTPASNLLAFNTYVIGTVGGYITGEMMRLIVGG